jgi:RNA polymerase sigma factor (sigma-70 family)
MLMTNAKRGVKWRNCSGELSLETWRRMTRLFAGSKTWRSDTHIQSLGTSILPKTRPRRLVFKQCDRLTRRKRLKTVGLDSAVGLATEDVGPAVLAEQRELSGQVGEALQALTPRERPATVLFYIGEYSQREISAFLDVPVSTVKSRLHSARKRLRERMLNMVEEELYSNRPSRDESFATVSKEMLLAATAGDLAQIDALLKRDPDLVGPQSDPEHRHDYVTRLHHAAWGGQLEAVKLLLEHGADVNAVEPSHGLTPLGYARLFPRGDLTKFVPMANQLITHGAKADIFCVASLGMVDEVEAIPAVNPDLVNARPSKSDERMQPLHVAALRGQIEVAECLLAHSADPNATDDGGRTPLAWAEAGNQAGMARIFGSI